MKNKHLILSFSGLVILLSGCSTMLTQNINEVTTPAALSKYKNIDELIATSPNLKGSKEYYSFTAEGSNNKNSWTAEEYRIPVETLRSYCQNIELGIFSLAEPKKTLLKVTKINALEGLYTCKKQTRTLWAANVNIVNQYISDREAYKSVTYKVDKVNGESYDQKIQTEALMKKRDDEEYAKRVAYNNQAANRKKQAYLDSLKKFNYITKSTSNGTTICRHHDLEYMYIYGTTATEPYPRKVIIQGVLEKNQSNSTNVQVRLRGAKANWDSIVDLKGKLNGSPIKSGELVWDDRKHWYICQ